MLPSNPLQSAVDLIVSATYAENYLDCVENLPGDIQRHITRVHELDVMYRNYLKEATSIKEVLEKGDIEVIGQRRALNKLEQLLICLQEVGDQKVEVWQQVSDLIDSRSRSLDQDLRNLDYKRDVDPIDTVKDNVNKDVTAGPHICLGPTNSANLPVSSTSDKANNNGTSGGSSDRVNKRARRSRNDLEANDSPIPETRSSGTSGTTGPANTSGVKLNSGNGNSSNNVIGKGTTTTTKKKKRKSRQREETPPREEEVQHDLDEPTYCLCDQISYGEMILCDNDLCPIEWFHFVCVSLTTKPKGRWFCPKCRGDRPNVMKPKSQFLKELERYNKEKEEKA